MALQLVSRGSWGIARAKGSPISSSPSPCQRWCSRRSRQLPSSVTALGILVRLFHFGGDRLGLGTWLARRYFGVDAVTGIVAGFCSAQANTVFVGVPLILEAYGDEGAVPLFLLIAIHLPIMVTVGSIFSEGRSTQLPRLVRQLVTNPILLGIFVSVAARLLDLAVPVL